MAFTLQTLNRTSSGANDNAPICWSYASTTDAAATIEAAGYFNDVFMNFSINDQIYVQATDGPGFYNVTAVTPNVTISALATIGAGGIGTAQLQDASVTTAKIANNAVTSALLDVTTLQYVKVSLTSANLKAMYATPVVIIAAPAADHIITVKESTCVYQYSTAQYTAGGALGFQYDTTAHLAGVLASGTLAGATFDGFAANNTFQLRGANAGGLYTATVGKGLYISNDTAAFATGSGTMDVYVWYTVTPTT